MTSRNMAIFQKLLEKRLLTLRQLQIGWEQTHKNLKYAQHKDLAKVVVALGYISADDIDVITRQIDGLPRKETEKIYPPENTEAFMDRMQEISKRLQVVDDEPDPPDAEEEKKKITDEIIEPEPTPAIPEHSNKPIICIVITVIIVAIAVFLAFTLELF